MLCIKLFLLNVLRHVLWLEYVLSWRISHMRLRIYSTDVGWNAPKMFLSCFILCGCPIHYCKYWNLQLLFWIVYFILNCVSFCFMYFWTMFLGAYMLIIVISSWWCDCFFHEVTTMFFIITAIILSLSLVFFKA